MLGIADLKLLQEIFSLGKVKWRTVFSFFIVRFDPFANRKTGRFLSHIPSALRAFLSLDTALIGQRFFVGKGNNVAFSPFGSIFT